jgi:GH15 family glucan-1,4-alpha-glucosidase
MLREAKSTVEGRASSPREAAKGAQAVEPSREELRRPAALPIEDYAIIGNTLTCALVGRNGSIDWLCLPRFDSPACFAALVGAPANGRWLIAPRGKPRRIRRAYREGTLILETTFETEEGRVTLIDFMPPPSRREGAVDVVRILRGEAGSVPMRMQAVFRFDYGQVAPWVRRRDYGLHAIAGPDALQLSTPLELHGTPDMTTEASFTVRDGQMIPCVLTWHPSHQRAPRHPDAKQLLEATERAWRDWSSRYQGEGEWREPVLRSLITLKALSYHPTGGIVAAATTSLPERLGGVRNWDYRYCWLRDATFALYALIISNYGEEARDWSNWLLRAVAGEPANVQIMYGLAGERHLGEYELPWLPGYEGSQPVRVGNAAHTQRQMDIYGEVMDALHSARKHNIKMGDDIWRIQSELMAFLEKHWDDPGSGIWEMRGRQRHFTHARVMAWVAVDRAVKAVERFELKGPVERWRALRDTIHKDVCRRGFSRKRNAFVQYYGSDALDASLLLMPLVGFLPARDPRVVSTIEAIQRELTAEGLVLRYRTEETRDGLPAGEGVFLACSFWLADCLAAIGRKGEARKLFRKLLALRNDVGLLAEEYDPHTRRQLGNFPQAFSHVGLINTAHNLSREHGPAKHRASH